MVLGIMMEMTWARKGAHNKNYTRGRAVLLANSHAGEVPARDAGPNIRLLEAGRPGSVRRNGLKCHC